MKEGKSELPRKIFQRISEWIYEETIDEREQSAKHE
jgi:hypothetical protein